MLNRGRNTPVKIEILLSSLNVSAMYDGIQVDTPSRKIPCRTIASIIAAKIQNILTVSLNEPLLFTLSSCEPDTFGHFFIQTADIITAIAAEQKNIDFQPPTYMQTGARAYTIIVPMDAPHEMRAHDFL